MKLQNLEPRNIMYFFEQISTIVPRGSGQEEKISQFMVSFAQERHLEVFQDKAYNVVIKKEATPGYQNAPTVILQAHMDMVNEKNRETQHDFEKDPIDLIVKEGWIYANGTTLGADDGAGLAMILAVLDAKDIPHPALEVIFTTGEETGMTGVLQFNPKLYHLKGSFLINLDTGEECQVGVSCLGGCRTDLRIPYQKTQIQGEAYHLSIGGLKGGHSGENIDDGLGNSNKILARFLQAVLSQIDIYIAQVSGGNKENAIPREADVIFFMDPNYQTELLDLVKEWESIFKQELQLTDPDIFLNVENSHSHFDFMLDLTSTRSFIHVLNAHPNGVLSRNFSLDKIPQTSLNTAVLAKEDGVMRISANVRSSNVTELEGALSMLRSLAVLVGGTFGTRNCYAPWQFDPQSKLTPLVSHLAQGIFGRSAPTFAIQGGTEVGVLKSLFHGELDCVSIGPTMEGIHTPNERLNIESFAKTYQWLLAILKAIKE